MQTTTIDQPANNYNTFIQRKSQLTGDHGFAPSFMPDYLFDFQSFLVDWQIRKGRGAIFSDCGTGKTIMELVFAQNIVEKTNGRVLVLTPLAVGPQTRREGARFGIECCQSRDGKFPSNQKIIVTNYERLHYFDSNDFAGVVCDESSILKNYDGATKKAVTDFMKKIKYRMLGTATASPNDFTELGTSSEALGYLGHIDMLGRFFKNDNNTNSIGGRGSIGAARFAGANLFGGKWRFRGHAERDFWRWVCSWARIIRKPSDLGFSDNGFVLPKLITRQHVVVAREGQPGMLFDLPAITLQEQREERARTCTERCEMAAEIANNDKDSVVVWCNLNKESDLLRRLIPDGEHVVGSDTDERKEEMFAAFQDGSLRVLITKPTIAGFGLNWQHCRHQTFFPSHSFEQWYQAIRRSWRFGQTSDVTIDVVASEGEARILENLKRKQEAANTMFAQMIEHMTDEYNIDRSKYAPKLKERKPQWLSSIK